MKAPSQVPLTRADTGDRWTLLIVQPAALCLKAAALFAPRLIDEVWPIALGTTAVSLILVEYPETM